MNTEETKTFIELLEQEAIKYNCGFQNYLITTTEEFGVKLWGGYYFNDDKSKVREIKINVNLSNLNDKHEINKQIFYDIKTKNNNFMLSQQKKELKPFLEGGSISNILLGAKSIYNIQNTYPNEFNFLTKPEKLFEK